MKKKKIGGVIVSDLGHTNYGSFLQAYATLKVVESFGHELTFIKYKKQRSLWDWMKIAPGLMMSGGMELIKKRLQTKLNAKFRPSYWKNQLVRRDAVDNVKKELFVPHFKEYEGYKALCEGSKEFDAVFVGSDQVWRPFGFYSNYWNLMFVDDSIPKFSYAASYGVSNIPAIQRKGTKKYLERLDMISVREQRGKEIVEALSNKKAQVVADPTMLLTREQWEEFAMDSTIEMPSEHYMFCYFLGTREDIRQEAFAFAQKNNLKIVTMRHMDEYVPIDENFGDYAPYNISPYDFVKLLKNADYVFTDSFHGTVFSILMQKQFFTFYRTKPTAGNSTHTRIDGLLNKFGLASRICMGGLADLSVEIDYTDLNAQIEDFRGYSLDLFSFYLGN